MESYCKPPKNLSFHGDLSENWRKFKQNFHIFLKASEIEEKRSDIKVALLLNFMGEDGVELYNSFNLDSTEKDDIEKVIQAFQNYCAAKKNIVSESVKFMNRSQADGETIDSYITSLEKLSESCEYGFMRDRMIRNRLVAGIWDRVLHERLLKTADLDLQKALEICRAGEASEAKKKGAGKKRKKQNSECEIEFRPEDTGVKEKANGGEIGITKEDANKARSEATFRYTVKNISKRKMKDFQLSPPCYVSNLSWKIRVIQYTGKTPAQKTLGFFLKCESDRKSASWSCYAFADLRVLSNKEGAEPFSRKMDKLFDSELEDWGFRDFMSWKDLLDAERGYVKDDSITLEAGASGSGYAAWGKIGRRLGTEWSAAERRSALKYYPYHNSYFNCFINIIVTSHYLLRNIMYFKNTSLRDLHIRIVKEFCRISSSNYFIFVDENYISLMRDDITIL